MTIPEGRWNGPEVEALVASDTFDLLVERIRGLFSHDRRVVWIERQINTERPDQMTVRTGLRLETTADWGCEDPIEVTESTFGIPSRSLNVRLITPGSTYAFGFTAGERTSAQMSDAWNRRGRALHKPVTQVRIDGWADTPSRDDSITIERWNDDAVGTITTVQFQADWG